MNERTAAGPPPPESRRGRSTPVPPVDVARAFGIGEALRTTGDADAEVYVGWETRPVGVVPWGRQAGAENWEIVGPILRERVLAAVEPLLATGWHLAGSFTAAARWDMTRGTGRDLYEGCWVRMRRGGA